MKLLQDMQLIQKLRADQKCLKKVCVRMQAEEIKLEHSSRSRSLKTISRNAGHHSYHFTLFLLVGNIEIVVKRANQKEYRLNEADFPILHLNDIEDMFILVKDVQLGVESYQTKLNLTRPHVSALGVDDKEPYTIFYKPRGVIYESGNGFGDATIMKVRDELKYRLNNFRIGYNKDMPTRPWSEKDLRRTESMLKVIEKSCIQDE
ncbi:hypothetical protein Tco_0349847 [Tanacetum coccineum]